MASFYAGTEVSPLVVQSLMRHSTMAMTEHYVHITEAQQREAVRTVDLRLGEEVAS